MSVSSLVAPLLHVLLLHIYKHNATWLQNYLCAFGDTFCSLVNRVVPRIIMGATERVKVMSDGEKPNICAGRSMNFK